MGWRRLAFVLVGITAAAASIVAYGAGSRLVATVDQPAERVAGPPRRVTVVAGGDVLTESRVRQVAAGYGEATGRRFDFAPMFAPVRQILESADLAICHMELPIGTPGGAYGNHGRSPFGGNRLVAPYEIATGVRDAGFDRCSTASNHSYDVGDGGIASTLAALDAHGLGRTGTARSPGESLPSHVVIDGIDVAHISFTVGSNTVVPAEPWRLNVSRNPDVIAAHVARARSDGARIVLLSVHLTQEMLTEPTPADRALITAVVERAPVDAVFVHGPHVVQPFEFVRGVPVWWSLGNFVSEMGGPTATGKYVDPRTGDGLLAHVRFTEFADGSFLAEPETIAICNERNARTVRPASLSLDAGGLSAALRTELQACLARTRSIVPTAT
jgi:poly-gamma-glutamate synthesis protein (capsule biosynthesis protein)